MSLPTQPNAIHERIGPHQVLSSRIGNSASALVLVSDQHGFKAKAEVLLTLQHGRWTVEQGMTAEQARVLAVTLMKAAERADAVNEPSADKVAA